MSSLIRKILSNSSTRIILLVFIFLLGIGIYFIADSYYRQLVIYQDKILSELQSITNTLSTDIDGNAYGALLSRYPDKNDIKTNGQDVIYKIIHEKLKEAKEINKLQTAIYTLNYDSANHKVFFGVSSSENPYFRHTFEKYPKLLIKNYKKGGVIPPYTDENNTWLSAFSPIKDKNGKVVGVVEADQKFDAFISAANKAIWKNIFISIGILIVVGFFMLRSIRRILIKEEEMSRNLVLSKSIIEQKNKDITDSIAYAKRIQDSLLPSSEKIAEAFDHFVYYQPRDIVSGDFYWFCEKEDKYFLAVADCTGHGVPGAFMSMIGHALLNEIVNILHITDAGKILDALDDKLHKALQKSDNDYTSPSDGMDIAICVFDKKLKTVQYSGAFRPLLLLRNNQITEYKGDRFAIGGSFVENKKFSTHTIDLQQGDHIYLSSDGYVDQFGGDEGKKLKTKNFKELLINIHKHPLKHQENKIISTFEEWKQDYEQVDDILVIGLKIN